MIFITVGTHEQPFNRLVEYMDKWAETHDESVVIQTGFSTYEPKCAKWCKMLPYQELVAMYEKARIVITHGGPSSFIMSIQMGKIPIVVPRRREHGEHVNNHQVDFCKVVKERNDNIILVEETCQINQIIENYDSIIVNMKNNTDRNNKVFCERFAKIVDALVR